MAVDQLLPTRRAGIQTDVAMHQRPGHAIYMLVSMPNAANLRFRLGEQTYGVRDLWRLMAQQGAVGIEELFERNGLAPAAVAEYLDDLLNSSTTPRTQLVTLDDARIDCVYHTRSLNLHGVERSPTTPAPALAERSLEGLSARASGRLPTRNFFELIGEAFLEFFAAIARLFGSDWNPDTALMNGALSDAQKADARRLGDELVASHGPLLFTIWQQPDGRNKLRERMLESGRPDGVTSATWEQAVDLALERISASFTEHPPTAMTPREAEGVRLYLAAQPDHAAAQGTLAAFFRERLPPLSSDARGRALELLAAASPAGQQGLLRLFAIDAAHETDVSRRFGALPQALQLSIVEIAAHEGFACSDETLLRAIDDLSVLRLDADEGRLLARALGQLNSERLGWALDRQHGLPARLAALGASERRRLLIEIIPALRNSADLRQELAGGGTMTVRNTRATTLTATERAAVTRTFNLYDLSLNLSDAEGRRVRVVGRTTVAEGNERIILLADLLADNGTGRALRRELGLDTADLHRLLRNVNLETLASHSRENATRLADIDQRLSDCEASLRGQTDPDGNAWTPVVRQALDEQIRALRIEALEIAPLSNLAFDISRDSALGIAFGIYDGRTDSATAVARRTSEGVAFAGVSTAVAELGTDGNAPASLFGVASSNYFQSTTADRRHGVRGSQAASDRLLRDTAPPSVARVVNGYASLDGYSDASGVHGLETGVAAGDVSAWEYMAPEDVRVVTVSGHASGVIRTVSERATDTFRAVWNRAGGVSRDQMVDLRDPGRQELLDTLRAQIMGSYRGQGVAFYYVGHMLIDAGNMEREGWMMANGEFISASDLEPLLMLAEQRGIHFMMLVDSCHGDAFVDQVRSRTRVRINDAGGDMAVDVQLANINQGMRDLFRSSEFLGANQPDADVRRLASEEGVTLETNTEIERAVRAKLADPTAGAALDAIDEHLQDLLAAFSASLDDEQAIVDDPHHPEHARARRLIAGMRQRLRWIQSRADAVSAMVVAVALIQHGREELQRNPRARTDYATILNAPILSGARPLPSNRDSASSEMGPLSDLIAAASLREARLALGRTSAPSTAAA